MQNNRVRKTTLGILVAIVVVLGAAAGPAAAGTIRWDDFQRVNAYGGIISNPTYAPSGEDRIQLLEEHGVAPAGTVEVVLKSAPWITAWKGLEVDRTYQSLGCYWWWGWHCSYSPAYSLVAGLYTQDGDHGPIVRQIQTSYLNDGAGNFGQLRFGKAKLFGIHTGMYELPFDAYHAQSGSRYTFTWVSD
jgi:hypothetical protein